MSSKEHEAYLHARCELEEAVRNLATSAYVAGFNDVRIACDISDVAYDFKPKVYTEMQKLCLPFVKEFYGTKSVKNKQVITDWKKIADQWEKNKMWEKLNRY